MMPIMDGGEPKRLNTPDLAVVAAEIPASPETPVISTVIPTEAIIGWLAALDVEIVNTVEQLRANKPSMFAHPILRLRHVGAMALQAGKRQVVNYIAEKVVGHYESEQ